MNNKEFDYSKKLIDSFKSKNALIGIIGLGYVGLPICIKLAKNYKIVGFDINSVRINSLKKGIDLNDEFKKKDLKKKNLFFSKNIQDINNCNFYIIFCTFTQGF